MRDPAVEHKQMRVLFYEPTHTGHHFAYLARMLPAFVDLPIEAALATTAEAANSEQFRSLLSPFADRLDVLPWCRPLGKVHPWRNAWRRCRDLASATKRWQPDHVCVLYGDGMWQLAALARLVGVDLLGNAPVYEAWMYRGGFAYADAQRWSHRFYRWLFRRLLMQRVFTKIHFDDELLIEYVHSSPPTKTAVVLPANPVRLRSPKTASQARAELDI